MDTKKSTNRITGERFAELMKNANRRPLELTREEAQQLRRVLIGTKRGIDTILSIIEPKLGIDNNNNEKQNLNRGI